LQVVVDDVMNALLRGEAKRFLIVIGA